MSEYPSKIKTRKYFIAAILLFIVQMLLGLVMSVDVLARDSSTNLPLTFDILKALHLNLMVLWLLLGFIGGLYYLLPVEAGRDIKHPRLIDIQFWFLLLIGIGIIISEIFFTGRNWWLVEGREYLEAGRFWDILLTIWFDSIVAAEYFRWWVVHYWVEASFELIAAGVIALILLAMTQVRREIIEIYLAIEVALILLTGIIGQGHHYYWIGTPGIWIFLGGLFSALEPVPLFLMVWSAYKDLKENKKPIPNKVVLYLIIGATIGNFVGAGLWGFIHTLPQINFFTHGTQITSSHAHFATPGTYLLLVIGIAYLAIPEISGRLNFSQYRGKIGFWLLVIGFLNMIIALMIAGVIQVYQQRVEGLSFMSVQNTLLPYFGWRLIGGLIAFAGGLLIAYDLILISTNTIKVKGERNNINKEI